MKKRELNEQLEYYMKRCKQQDDIIADLAKGRIDRLAFIDGVIRQVEYGKLTPDQARDMFGVDISDKGNTIDISDYGYAVLIKDGDIFVYQNGNQLKRVGRLSIDYDMSWGETPVVEIEYR